MVIIRTAVGHGSGVKGCFPSIACDTHGVYPLIDDGMRCNLGWSKKIGVDIDLTIECLERGFGQEVEFLCVSISLHCH